LSSYFSAIGCAGKVSVAELGNPTFPRGPDDPDVMERMIPMNPPYTYLADLNQEAKPPADGILSRTLYEDEHVKVVLFGFGPGQELSEHTSTMPAILQFVSGEARLTLGDDTLDAGPGSFVRMPAGLRHGIQAKTPTVLLLLLLRSGRTSA
jgi:quercetin dioxygenase-like cupin family protein